MVRIPANIVLMGLLWGYLACFVPVGFARISINEVMTSNSMYYPDEDGEYHDWIELYNHGYVLVNVEGWGISDRWNKLFRWTLPSVVIPPGKFLVIFASGKDRKTPSHSHEFLHASFRLASEGEALVLTRPDGTTADVLDLPRIPRDTSYGRVPDGIGAWHHFVSPTPLGINTGVVYAPPPAVPVFSHARGFHNEPFMLELWHYDAEAALYYTVNGSEPAEHAGIPYTGPIPITNTTVVRAAAFIDGALPRPEVMTHSYFFLDDILQQRDDPDALGMPAKWGSWEHTHYGFNPEVSEHPDYAPRMVEALTAIPSLSLVVDMDDMFDPSIGIYANRTRRGVEWERPVSVEWLDPHGRLSFQVNAGIRAQGGASRSVWHTPKSSFRLLFKGEYGMRRLMEKMFGQAGSPNADYNSIVLRAEFNNAWLHHDLGGSQRHRGLYMRDQYIRALQIAMTGHGSHGSHVHLYINGVYWGLYNPSERPDAAFGAAYFGGEREDWDAYTHRGVRDGDAIAWDAAWSFAETADFSHFSNYEIMRNEYLNIPQYIDYMVLNIWAGIDDWPGNNWNAIRKREPGAGWTFFCWDAERSMETLLRNRAWASSGAAHFYHHLRNSPEFRLQFADRVHRHLFNNGVLTPVRTIPRFAQLAEQVEASVIAESARWGSYRRDKHEVSGPGVLLTRNSHWVAERDRILHDYLPQRTDIVITQFRRENLYPATAAPAFIPHGGVLNAGEALAMTGEKGTIYYTLNGADPREYGTGNVSAYARIYSAPLTFSDDAVVKARALHEGEWSALNEARFIVPELVPHPLADHPYFFSEWAADAPAGTYPPHMQFMQTAQSDPGYKAALDEAWTMPYNLADRSRINGLGTKGISFINTGNAQDDPGAGYVGAAVLALNTLECEAAYLQWTAGTVLPNERIYALRPQYRVGGVGPFYDLLDENNRVLEYMAHPRRGHARTFGPVAFPDEAIGRPYVEIRWVYWHVFGSSGPRPQLRLDDIRVTSTAPSAGESLAFGASLPSHWQSGRLLPPLEVRAQNSEGWVDRSFNGFITLGIAGDASLEGTTTVAADRGVALFTNLIVHGVGTFQINATASGVNAGHSDTVTVSDVAGVIVPQFMQGERDRNGNNYNRVPYAYHARIEGLRPHSIYRYANRVIHDGGNVETDDGAGNMIFVAGNEYNWIRATSAPRFRSGDIGQSHHEFVTDADGAYAGWFVTEPSGNERFTPGHKVNLLIMLNDGRGGDLPQHYLTITNTVHIVGFGETPRHGSALMGQLDVAPRHVVLLYDNVEGAGRPLAGCPIENTGSETDEQYAAFYHHIVAPYDGAWGTIIPNTLSSGVQRIEVRDVGSGEAVHVEVYSAGIPRTVMAGGGLKGVMVGYDEHEAMLLPGGNAVWDNRSNWTADSYPNAPGIRAIVRAPEHVSRTVTLRKSIVLGELDISNHVNNVRNRIAGLSGSGSRLLFSAPSDAQLRVTGNGEGFAEVRMEGGTVLLSDLRLIVEQVGGDKEYGALRLREGWLGVGGLIKEGVGTASLTGAGKAYTGNTLINQGVLQVTAPAAPSNTRYVAVTPGGQLRLVSASTADEPIRTYTFGGNIMLNSLGRGGAIPEHPDHGNAGGLRYEPGSVGNSAEVLNNLMFSGASEIHVAGAHNSLIIRGILSGSGSMTKSGDGTLRLRAISRTYDAPITIQAGTLMIDGRISSPVTLNDSAVLGGLGRLGPIQGAGSILPSPDYSGILSAASISDGLEMRVTMSTGDDGTALFLTADTPFGTGLTESSRIALFLSHIAFPGLVFEGGIMTQAPEDFFPLLGNARMDVYVPDEAGNVLHNSLRYKLYEGSLPYSITTVPANIYMGADGTARRVLRLSFRNHYRDWQVAQFGVDADDPSISGLYEDPDNSGIPNLLRFAFGLGRYDPYVFALPRFEALNNRLIISFRELLNTDSGIEYVIDIAEGSVTAPWIPATLGRDVGLVEITSSGDGLTREVRYQLLTQSHGHARFMRVRVNLP